MKGRSRTGSSWLARSADEVTLGLAGLAFVAVAMLVIEASLGLHPGVNFAFACVLVLMLVWSALGLRAAIAEPDVGRWSRLAELAQIRGAVAAVDLDGGHGGLLVSQLADLMPDARLHRVGPASVAALALSNEASDAVVFGPGIATLDDTTRVTLLDEARRVLRAGGRLVLMVPAPERARWPSAAPVEWEPGAPPGWWSDVLAERFESVRHAPLSRHLEVLLATRPGPS